MTAKRKKKQPPPPRKTPCELCAAGKPCGLAMTPADCAGAGGGPFTRFEVTIRMDYNEGE